MRFAYLLIDWFREMYHSVSQAGLEVVVLAQIPGYYDYRHATIHLTQERSFCLVYFIIYLLRFFWTLPGCCELLSQVHVILIILFIGDLTVLFILLICGIGVTKEVLVVGAVLFFCGVFLFPYRRLDRLYELTYFKLCYYCSVLFVSPVWNSILEENLGFESYLSSLDII